MEKMEKLKYRSSLMEQMDEMRLKAKYEMNQKDQEKQQIIK